METGYFYSKSTGLFIAREPLMIDARVIKAALECDIQLNWDEEGRINYFSLYESLDLLQKLGATMLTIKDYWLVLRDAIEANDVQMIKELQSDRYTEWLNTLIEKKEYMISNLSVQRKGKNYRYQGRKLQVQIPFGHPGWFEPKDVDLETGLPQKVELNREKHSTTWKYWSFCDYNYIAAAVRGWVTSVGKPSLDLGIPADAVYPVLLLRECRKELLQPPVDARVLKEITALISDYEELARQNNYQKLYAKREAFLRFISEHGTKFQQSREMEIYKIREKIGEIIGILRVIAKNEKDALTLKRINQIARKIWELKQSKIEFRDFLAFVQSSRKRLEKAISDLKPIVFVIGHNNPDTDTVISALAEAFRNHLVDGEKTAYVPVVQGEKIPDEAKRLLGKRLSQSILLSNDTLYEKVKISGQARWIMVDHNKNSEIQKFAVSIIDHHTPSEIALKQNVSKTLEMIGSTTALIVQKINGLGIDIAEKLSCIFYGATLMDTENRSELKMTQKDRLIMDDLKKTSDIKSDAEFYRDLMNFLLGTDDIRLLFARDYKEDWAFFGFAVAKVKGVFDEKGTVQKKKILDGLIKLARQNNAEKNLSLTIIKIVDYRDDNETINRERIYLIFNERIFPEFKKTMFDLVSTLVNFTFKGKALLKKTADFIDFWGIGKQLSRKRTAPFLELIAIAFNEYFYSPATRLYVKRDFLKATKRVKETAKKYGIHLSWDEKERINNITYGEAIQLLEYLGFTAMSLREYWAVLADAKSFNDQQMLLHLKSSGFVEFLHTLIEDVKYAIEKPKILQTKSTFQYEGVEVVVSYSYEGQKQTISVPKGTPGLINPKDIEPKTGLPKIVHPPDIYKNPHLWRYWSPDAEKNVATRSYIFLLGQPALDLKVHLSESFDCLGIRPCCKKVELPEVKIIESDEGITLIIKKEGETTKIQGKEFFEKGSN